MSTTAMHNLGLTAASAATTRSAALQAAGPRAARHDISDRKTVGEFVGNAFYGTLLKEMQSMKLKGSLLHGGRGEEVFGGQLAMEMAKRISQSPNDPLAEQMYRVITKRAGKEVAPRKLKMEPIKA